ncbi:MAG: twin-arginine translocase TatA/TatE family subunit [Parachlamydiales bacterium]|jgi:sec-independent protein translocase protein TatA
MFGSGELLVILLLILFLFGGKKLPELAKSLGEGIREFKKACNGESEESATTHEIPVKVEKISTTEEKDDKENVKS